MRLQVLVAFSLLHMCLPSGLTKPPNTRLNGSYSICSQVENQKGKLFKLAFKSESLSNNSLKFQVIKTSEFPLKLREASSAGMQDAQVAVAAGTAGHTGLSQQCRCKVQHCQTSPYTVLLTCSRASLSFLGLHVSKKLPC